MQRKHLIHSLTPPDLSKYETFGRVSAYYAISPDKVVLKTSTQLFTHMTTTYLFDKASRANVMSMQRQAISIIQSFFAKYPTLVGKPIFTVSPDKVIVQLFYYSPVQSLGEITTSGIVALGNALTRC